MPEWVHCDIYFSVDCSSTPKHTVSSPHVAFLHRVSLALRHLGVKAMQADYHTSLLLLLLFGDVFRYVENRKCNLFAIFHQKPRISNHSSVNE